VNFVVIAMSNYIILIRDCMILAKYFLAITLLFNSLFMLSQASPPKNGVCLVNTGLQFLGAPYQAGILDQNQEEQLISSTAYFDCVTLVEHLLATCLAGNQTLGSEKKVEEFLQHVRYRAGKIDGYPSRLHYFSEWIDQQEDNGYLTNITKYAGGVPVQKPIHFMTSHRHRYQKLKSQQDFNAIREIEKRLSKRTMDYIPLNKLNHAEKYIQAGDIIVLTSGRAGLDVEHTGIAVLQSGRIHLLHASSMVKKVAITRKSLVDYASSVSSFTGIIILRPMYP
jgi:uncharacterized protein YbgA (DUF1722 family)